MERGIIITTMKEILKNFLVKQREEFREFKKISYVVREKEEELTRYLKSSLIKIVVGPRRCGKSRLIQKVLENQKTAYINFEDEIFSTFTSEEIIEEVESLYPNNEYWYLDEIQEYPNWETFVNKLHRRKKNIVITGSNAKMLSSELATLLTGRHFAIELLPFSYAEYLSATKQEASSLSYLSYLNSGGFPEVVLNEKEFAMKYLATLFDSIVLKDLVRRKKIKNPNYLLQTLELIVNNISARTTARSLAKALNNTPSYTTIEKYLGYTTEAYLFEYLNGFANKTKTRLLSYRKPYAIDTGFMDSKSHSSGLFGKKLENSVFLRLRRLGLITNQDLFYYITTQGYEVDFIIRKSNKTQKLIQVSYEMDALETRAREIRALSVAQKEIGTKETELIIITFDKSEIVKQVDIDQSITIIPAYRFCLNE